MKPAHLTTTPEAMARKLVARCKGGALREASNRYDAANTEATAAFYERVMTAVERLQAAPAPAPAPAGEDIHSMMARIFRGAK
jgi:hypothetical protein